MTVKSYFDEAAAAVFAYRQHAVFCFRSFTRNEVAAFNKIIGYFDEQFQEKAEDFESIALRKQKLLKDALDRYPFTEVLDLSLFFTASRTIDDQMFGFVYRESREEIVAARAPEFARELSELRRTRERKVMLLQRNYNEYLSRLRRAEWRMNTPLKAASSVKSVVSICNDIQLEGVV